MGQVVNKYSRCPWVVIVFCGIVAGSLAAQDDPPSRVARLNMLEGNVSMQPSGLNDWAPAEINHPFTIGDYLYTDAGARAELHTDEAVLRMGSQTSFGFLNLNDEVIQLKLTAGDMSFRLHDLSLNQVFEIDTPNAAIQLVSDGVYRFRVDGNGNMTFVVVRSGQAQVTGGGQSFALNPGNSAQISGTDQLAFDVEVAPAPDEFDEWCSSRDAREAHLVSAQYVPPTVIGYEDLDTYGDWQPAPEYGPVWYPRQVPVDWAPYHNGHWAWVEPWGWTWVDAAPWGFAPFHYGRWAYIGNRWGWCPGPIAVGHRGPIARPYYAPALVAWFGGRHWGVSITSEGPSLGWVPLGYGEVFTPAYRCSRPYFSRVNADNTHVDKTVNIINVYNTVYVNKTVYNQQFVNSRAPNGVYAMRQSEFAGGQPVHRAGYAVSRAQFEQSRTGGPVIAPPITPQRPALLGNNLNRPVARPNQQVLNRTVMAVQTPPPSPVSFQARQQDLQNHAGQLHGVATMPPQVAPQTPAAVSVVRAEAKAQPVTVRPGEHLRGGRTITTQTVTPAPSQPNGAPAPQMRPPREMRPPQAQSAGQTPVTRVPVSPQPPTAAQPGYPAAPGRPREAVMSRSESQSVPQGQRPQNNPAYPHSEVRPAAPNTPASAPPVQPRQAPPSQPAVLRPSYERPEVRQAHVEPAGPREPSVVQHPIPARQEPQPVHHESQTVREERHSAPAHQDPPPAHHEEHHSAPTAPSQPEHKDQAQKSDDHKGH